MLSLWTVSNQTLRIDSPVVTLGSARPVLNGAPL
jgi:hypothetical protein